MGKSVVLLLALWIQSAEAISNTEVEAQQFLAWYNTAAEQQIYTTAVAQWNHKSNINNETELAANKAIAAYSTWAQMQAENASQFDLTEIENPVTKRLLEHISTVGIALNASDTHLLNKLMNKMVKKYTTSKICGWVDGSVDCSVQWPLARIAKFLRTCRYPNALAYVWDAWRKETAGIKPIYKQFITLSNKGAVAAGYADTGAWWRSLYETPNFRQQMQQTFYEILPLYEQLHTYVRRKLKSAYPDVVNDNYIPAHLTGNMHAEQWENIFSLVVPFENQSLIDVTETMKEQNYTPQMMFHLADDFFQSLGLIPLPEAFWNKSIITKPVPERDIVCHPSAWDFHNGKDFRILMCTEVTMQDLITIHHEMGHIQYFMQYADQPKAFHEGANPGFHEGIGDTLALSVYTPAHLQTIGLLPNYTPNPQQDINYLMKQALQKVAFLPWGYLMDVYRWEIYNGSLPYDQWNEGWWNLRNTLQGVKAPVPRPADAFDAASKYHTGGNFPYVRYFVSFILQFQFYKSMCDAAGWEGPLYQCDFHNNKAAGTLLADMLSMGASEPWPKAMERMTGQPNMDASALKEYFRTLSDWLEEENRAAGDCFGWGVEWPNEVLCTLPTPRCGGIPTPDCPTKK